MLKKTIGLLVCLALFSCSSESGSKYDAIAGNYILKSVTTNIPVDFNADGIFENDITNYVSCASNLNITSDGNVAWIGMSLEHASYSMELNTGNIVNYSAGICNTAASNYTGMVTENNDAHVMILSMFDEDIELVKVNNKLILKDDATLVVQEDNVLKLKSVSISFGYQKN